MSGDLERIRRGDWLWATREGAEADLVEEIGLVSKARTRAAVAAPGLVRSGALSGGDDTYLPTFGRQGFVVDTLVPLTNVEASIDAVLSQNEGAWTLHVWVPDTEESNRLSSDADTLRKNLVKAFEARPSRVPLTPSAFRQNPGEFVVHAALIAPDTVAVGHSPTAQTSSLWPGGRARMKVAGERPSRAARKLEEAFALFGHRPDPGELCVDLGAAPGGWSWLLLKRRARVIAVDPGKLRPELMRDRRLRYFGASAFQFTPDEPADWLFCDMAWRPHEVAKLLAKWAERRWARMLVANLKLPMKKKAATVLELRETLIKGGWSRLVSRQLYHDRDEITVLGVRL